jgi:succinyl-CoA synthetase beta subunit
MYLLEHDAKGLLAQHGVAVPNGALLSDKTTVASLPPGPWIVKGQITAGGRGKSGLIKKANTIDEVNTFIGRIIGQEAKGRTVRSVRVEQQVTGASEAYISLLLDPAEAGIRVIIAAQGGMEIESLPPSALLAATAAPNTAALHALIDQLTANIADPMRSALRLAGQALTGAFLAYEALLIEINPLFVLPEGQGVCAADGVATLR